jgi:hypothetical protein
MQRAEFESLLFVDVEQHAAAEGAPAEGRPKYEGRPWTQLRDRMLANGALSVAALPERTVTGFYRSTGSADGGVMGTLKGLFG